MKAKFVLARHRLGMLAVLCLTQSGLWAQTPSDTSTSWTATTEQQAPSANINPTKTTVSHTEATGRTTEKQAVQRLGPDGHYVPYLDTEKESVKVDATTVRTVERTFGRGPDGQKTLIQITEEETRTLPRGGQKIVRTTSNPDVNGRLQLVQREIQDTKQTSPDVRETKTTILGPSPNGGLRSIMQTEERETRRSDRLTEFRKSTLLPDGNGNWQVGEVREGVIKGEEGKDRSREESILRPGTDGKLAVVERTISKQSESAPGEKRQTTETYSTSVPGGSGDGSLNLNQRMTTVQRLRPNGGQITEEQLEQRNPGSPGDNLRVTQKTIDIVRPTLGGTMLENRTVQSLDSSGSLGVVWVDTQQSTHPPAIQVDTRKAENGPAVQVDTGPPSKPR